MLFSRATTPTLPSLSLSDEERRQIFELQRRHSLAQAVMELDQAYYLGEQIIDNLRIAVPKELEFLRTIVGWAAHAVDPYVERNALDGVRLAGGTDADPYLRSAAVANGLDAELPLAVTDALSMGRAYWSVGSPEEKGYEPKISVESPLNTIVDWDMRGTSPRLCLQQYWQGARLHAALLKPFETVHLAVNDANQWEIVDRDQHGFDFVPVVRMPNQPRTADRDGRSAITPALKAIIDSTCRTLLGVEVAREIYSVPQKLILGAAEDAFQKKDGTPKTAWETYITSVLALERDENGDLPKVEQLQAYDPSVFTKLVEMNASQAASIVLAPPQDFGLYTQGNPVSAEAQNTAESRRNRRSRLQQKTFGVSLAKVMQMWVRFDNDGQLPEQFRNLEMDWASVEETSPVEVSQAISTQITSGSVPATSDVVLKRLGYSAVERARLAQDRIREDGRQSARMIAESLTTGTPVPDAAPAPEVPSGDAAAGL